MKWPLLDVPGTAALKDPRSPTPGHLVSPLLSAPPHQLFRQCYIYIYVFSKCFYPRLSIQLLISSGPASPGITWGEVPWGTTLAGEIQSHNSQATSMLAWFLTLCATTAPHTANTANCKQRCLSLLNNKAVTIMSQSGSHPWLSNDRHVIAC